MLTIKGEATEQSNFHLVPHFEECSASVTINCEFSFWEFRATLGTCHKRQSWWAGLFIQSMTRMLKGEVPARFFLLSIAYLHITCSLGIQPMVHTIPTALVLYGTHLSIVSCIIVKNCPVIQKNASSSSPRLHMKTQLASVRDFTSNVLRNCAELQKLREVYLPPVEFHRTQLRKVRDFTCSALQNCEELKEFWKFASSSLWNSTSPN